MAKNPKPDVYQNARGETVMTLAVFKALSFDALCKALLIKKER